MRIHFSHLESRKFNEVRLRLKKKYPVHAKHKHVYNRIKYCGVPNLNAPVYQQLFDFDY